MKKLENGNYSGAILLLLAWVILSGGPVLQAQVINFDVPGGAGVANFSGQGAYTDSGNNYWNAINGGGTKSGCFLSDGITASSITLASQLGGTFGVAGTP